MGARRIEPDVHAADDELRQRHVVVNYHRQSRSLELIAPQRRLHNR